MRDLLMETGVGKERREAVEISLQFFHRRTVFEYALHPSCNALPPRSSPEITLPSLLT